MVKSAAAAAAAIDPDHDPDDAGLSCPICMISTDDEHGDNVNDATTPPTMTTTTTFVRTPCDHVFCRTCMERVLLLPRGRHRRTDTTTGRRRGGVGAGGSGGGGHLPTWGPCPMCGESVSLFNLRCAVASLSSWGDGEGDYMIVSVDDYW